MKENEKVSGKYSGYKYKYRNNRMNKTFEKEVGCLYKKNGYYYYEVNNKTTGITEQVMSTTVFAEIKKGELIRG